VSIAGVPRSVRTCLLQECLVVGAISLTRTPATSPCYGVTAHITIVEETSVCLPNPSKRANKRIKPTAFGVCPRVLPCLRAWCCGGQYLARGGGG